MDCLPIELIGELATSLTVKELCALFLVNKALHRLHTDVTLWQRWKEGRYTVHLIDTLIWLSEWAPRFFSAAWKAFPIPENRDGAETAYFHLWVRGDESMRLIYSDEYMAQDDDCCGFETINGILKREYRLRQDVLKHERENTIDQSFLQSLIGQLNTCPATNNRFFHYLCKEVSDETISAIQDALLGFYLQSDQLTDRYERQMRQRDSFSLIKDLFVARLKTRRLDGIERILRRLNRMEVTILLDRSAFHLSESDNIALGKLCDWTMRGGIIFTSLTIGEKRVSYWIDIFAYTEWEGLYDPMMRQIHRFLTPRETFDLVNGWGLEEIYEDSNDFMDIELQLEEETIDDTNKEETLLHVKRRLLHQQIVGLAEENHYDEWAMGYQTIASSVLQRPRNQLSDDW